MKPFEYYRVDSASQAISLLAKHLGKATILAGGSDLLTIMKDRLEGPKLKTPEFLVDIKGIKELAAIKRQKSGLRIGATATIADIASSDLIAQEHPLLGQAANQVAVPQIRNVATLGGNLCQRPRCWYFRGRLFDGCLRKGGAICYALEGDNQYHAILGARNCQMVNPSDMAPALIALGAQVEIASLKGSRTIPLERFYVGPEQNTLRENILTSEEMVIAVEIPAPASNSRGVYMKLRERQAFDFAIASVAVQLAMPNSIVSDARIVFGGLAPVPFRAVKAEAVLKGRRVKDVIPAVCGAATDDAQPLSGNKYKVDAGKGILEEALITLA